MAQAQDAPANAPPPPAAAPDRPGGTLVAPEDVPAPAAESPGWSLTSAILLALVAAAVILAALRFVRRKRSD